MHLRTHTLSLSSYLSGKQNQAHMNNVHLHILSNPLQPCLCAVSPSARSRLRLEVWVRSRSAPAAHTPHLHACLPTTMVKGDVWSLGRLRFLKSQSSARSQAEQLHFFAYQKSPLEDQREKVFFSFWPSDFRDITVTPTYNHCKWLPLSRQ